MELPRRDRGDELLQPGKLLALRQRLRPLAHRHDLTSVIACAFDHRTRMLPFTYADTRMVPAGVRAIGSAMFDAGFEKTRIVLQQWNRRFRPSQARLDGRIPDIFMVSSMQIHSAQCRALIRDACRIDPAHRPLIIVGGAKAIYEPWDAFNVDPTDPWGADCAVTGEEYVLLSLLERLLSMRAPGEALRTTFMRSKISGLVDDIAGLVYPLGNVEGIAEELVDTGIQRLVGDLDELPHPIHGYRLLEPPSNRTTLATRALEAGKVRKYSPIGSLVMTFGCKFACAYCPIPAYNQRQHRVKSGERIVDEMVRLHREYGIRYFFGTDDNFFNDKNRTLDIAETMARTAVCGANFRHKFRWGTEATVHDTLVMKDHLRLMRKAGLRALWLGVEDMTATLVKKGQSVDKTLEAFHLLRDRGICGMPMMIHHDSQPLYTRGSPYGLINQARLLRGAGAISLQVSMMTPSNGSKGYGEMFAAGLVFESVAGKEIEQHLLDGNHVVASGHEKPWRKQLNILAAYLYFYNPVRFLIALVRPRSRLYFAEAYMQLIGMWGLTQTIRRTLGWAARLWRGNIRRRTHVPFSRIPMRAASNATASHALPGTRQADLVQLHVKRESGVVGRLNRTDSAIRTIVFSSS
ncbi:MAG TPA: radical SAM protein [Phycisphaerae bacterium]|nr:radical SAM protein [Phycisphaerae bacterium]